MDNKEHQNIFAEYEKNHSDSYGTRIITQAKELEDLLNDQSGDLTEIDKFDIKDIEKEYIAAMDAECPYFHQKVIVTGKVIRADYNEFTEEFTLVHDVDYSNTQVTSAGFVTLELPDEQGGSKIQVGHLFFTGILDPVSQGQSLVDYLPRLYSFAPVGSVDIIADLPDRSNIELLNDSLPELMLEVEQSIWGAENECDALRRLRSVKLQHNHDTPKESLVAMLNFIEERLEMDTIAPYVVAVQGVVQTGESDSYLYYKERTDLLAYHTGLRFASYPYIRDGSLEHKEHGELMVELNVIGQNRSDPTRELIVPVRNIRGMYSIRDAIKG
jgi:hypothetical protein